MNSLLGLFKYLSNDAQLASITFWLLGGFYNTTYQQLAVAAPIIIIGIIVLFLFRWKIVMLRSGDGMQGMIGVVGPTRMDYAKVTARLSYFAESLSKLFAKPEQPQLPESAEPEEHKE